MSTLDEQRTVATLTNVSLRDWFAGQALAGMCADHTRTQSAAAFATSAYTLADAMLLARQSPPPTEKKA